MAGSRVCKLPSGLILQRRALPGRLGEVSHRFQEDLLQRVAAMCELPDEEILPRRKAPDRLELHAGGQDDAPASAALGNSVCANLRQRRAQVSIVAGHLELDEATVR